MDKDSVSLSVIEVNQRIGKFYIASIGAQDLVRIAHFDARRIELRDVERYIGIQRPLDDKRVKQIKEYLKSPDASFPTGVVLSIDERCADFDEDGHIILTPFVSEFDDEMMESIPLDKVAKILDGQHRIAAFIDKNGDFDLDLWNIVGGRFDFNVNVFVGLDIDEQANIFATVNLAQTKVNPSLAYDLQGLSKTRSPFKTCHQVAVALDSVDPSSPLFERIKRLGVKTKGRVSSEPLTQAAFVESLVKFISDKPFQDRVDFLNNKTPPLANEEELKKLPFRNLFLQNKDTDIALIIYNYFIAVKETWSQAWEATNAEGNILPRSNAFKALMRYLKNIYPELVNYNYGQVPTKEELIDALSHIAATDEDFTSGNFRPGSGGESAFYRLLTGQITMADLKN